MVGDIALLEFTANTCGTPKAAMITHGNLMSNICQMDRFLSVYEFGAEDLVATAHPLCHSFALTVSLFTFFASGSAIVIVPINSALQLFSVFNQNRISVVIGSPDTYNSIVKNPMFLVVPPTDLKLALCGGVLLNKSISRQFQTAVGQPIRELFGVQEASSMTHIQPMVGCVKPGSCGVPMPITDCRIVDVKGNDCGVNEEGELWVTGPQVMRGYWSQPAETAEVMEGPWLRSGYIGRCEEDGFFYLLGRLKRVISVGGFSLFFEEVESRLQQAPGIVAATVFENLVDDDENCVEAQVVVDKSYEEKKVRKYLNKYLAPYKHPKVIHVVDSIGIEESSKEAAS